MIARKLLFVLIVTFVGMGVLNLATAQGVCYDMRLIASDTLPNNISAWDFQHWADDSSFGWACVIGNGVHYKYRLSDSVAATSFSDSVMNVNEDFFLEYGQRVVGLIRTDSSSSGFAISLSSPGSWDWEEFEPIELGYIVLVGLPDGERIGTHQSFWFDRPCFHGSDLSYSFSRFIVWPPLPAISHHTLIAMWTTEYCDNTGDNMSYDRGSGKIFDLVHSVEILDLGCTHIAAIFSELSHMNLVRSMHFAKHTDCDIHPNCITYWSSLTAVQKVSIGGAGSPVDTLCYENFPCQAEGYYLPCSYSCDRIYVAAQQDSDGFQRIVDSYGRCTNALNNQLLWQNSEIGGWMTSALLPGSVNERIVSSQFDRHTVYDALTGAVIGRMSPMTGTLQYAIKRPNRTTEFVTYHEQTRIVRVYEPKFVVTDLTITRLPNSDIVRLKWNPVGGIAHYNIYGSSEYTGNYAHLADVNSGLSEWTTSVSQMDSVQFFYITAEY